MTEILESDFENPEKYFTQTQLISFRTDRNDFIRSWKENALSGLFEDKFKMEHIYNLTLTLEDNYLKDLKFEAFDLEEFLYGEIYILINDLKSDIESGGKPNLFKRRILRTESKLKRLEFAPLFISLVSTEILPDQRKKFSEFLVSLGIFESVTTTTKLFSEFNDQTDASKRSDAKKVIEKFNDAITFLKTEYKLP